MQSSSITTTGETSAPRPRKQSYDSLRIRKDLNLIAKATRDVRNAINRALELSRRSKSLETRSFIPVTSKIRKRTITKGPKEPRGSIYSPFRNLKGVGRVSRRSSFNTKFVFLKAQLTIIETMLWDIDTDLSLFSKPELFICNHNISTDLNGLINSIFSHLKTESWDPNRSSLENFFSLDIRKADIKTLGNIYEVSFRLLHILQSIGSKSGFINNFNLFDSSVYPLVHSLIPLFLDYNWELSKTKNPGDRIRIHDDRCANPVSFYDDILLKYGNKWNRIYYGWAINLAILGLFEITQKALLLIDNKNFTDLKTKSNFNSLSKKLYGYLDLDIRRHLQKRSVSIYQNIHGGFDVEYKQKHDLTYKNKLLSYQLAVSSSLQLNIPKTLKYKPEGVNPDTREAYTLTRFLPGMNKDLIIARVNASIKNLRSLMFNDHDRTLYSIIDLLKSREIPFFESKDKYTFVFPYTDVKKLIALPDEEFVDEFGILQGGITSVDLFKNIAFLVKPEITSSTSGLVESLRNGLSSQVKKASNDINLTDPDVESEGFLDRQQDLKSLNQIEISEYDFNRLKTEEEEEELSMLESNFGSSARSKSKSKSKHKIKFTPKSFKINGIKIRLVKRMSVYSHYNPADWSMLRDFDVFKEKLNIVHKSYTTLGGPRPLKSLGCEYPIFIRDTYLLAAAGSASLESIASMHGLSKGSLSYQEITNMDVLLRENWGKFKSYALQDSFISLIHGLFMEKFMFTLKTNTIPLTLGGISKKYCLNEWALANYNGYQPHPEYLLSQVQSSVSPKGLNEIGVVGLYLNMYIAAYKGGLNETFEYGCDPNTKFSDLDLNGCYTTIMGLMGNPDYKKATPITIEDLNKKSSIEIAHSFLVMDTTFTFPEDVAHPTIGVQVDKNLTGYIREGRATIMGSEYLIAKNLGCKFQIHTAFFIPFESKKQKGSDYLTTEVLMNKPFFDTIKKLHSLRKSQPKKSALEQVYKNLGNSLYGLTGQGLSNKKNFDIQSKSMVTMKGSKISNPLIAAFITGYVRSVVGEMLNNTHALGGRLISVTTDGFITDLSSLENRLLQSETKCGIFFLTQFREARLALGHPPLALEIKTEIEGINAWTTRGQVGIVPAEGYNTNIRAMTGYQAKNKNWEELHSLVNDNLKTSTKSLYFMRETLRAANDIYKKGGQVAIKHNEQKYSFVFDNKRQIVLPDYDLLTKITKRDPFTGVTYFDLSKTILQTKPWRNSESLLTSRFISKRLSVKIYARNDYAGNLLLPLNNTLDLCVRSLLRWYLKNKESLQPLPVIRTLAKILKKRLTTAFVERCCKTISVLRIEGDFIPNSVPNNSVSRDFLDLVYIELPEFYLDPCFNLENNFFQKEFKVIQPTRDRRDLLQTSPSAPDPVAKILELESESESESEFIPIIEPEMIDSSTTDFETENENVVTILTPENTEVSPFLENLDDPEHHDDF